MSSNQGSFDSLESLAFKLMHAAFCSVYATISVIFYKVAQNQKKELKQLQTQSIYTCEELFEFFCKKYYKKQNNNNKKRKADQQSNNEIIQEGYYFLQGVVSSHKHFPSIDNTKDLVYSLVKSEDINLVPTVNNQVIQQKGQSIVDIRVADHFFLYRPNGLTPKISEFSTISSNCKCIISQFQKTEADNVLKQIAFVEKINNSMKFAGSLVAGTILKIGYSQNEIGIKIGDTLIVYGKVILDLEKKIIRFQAPKFFLENKEQLVNYFELQISLKLLGCTAFAVLGFFHFYKIIRLFLQKQRQID